MQWIVRCGAAQAALTLCGIVTLSISAAAQAVRAPLPNGDSDSAPPAAAASRCDPADQSASMPPDQSEIAQVSATGNGDNDTAEACLRLPDRPAAPDIFGQAAASIGAGALRTDWIGVRDLALNGTEGGVDELLAQANTLTGGNPLAMVNRWVNWHIRFADDSQGDVWSSATETLVRGYGDCEDFAIAKMAILQRLGVSRDDMFLVLIRKSERPLDHAVLAVRREGVMHVLDNLTDYLQRDSDIGGYRPSLSYSGDFAWIYGSRAANETAARLGNPDRAGDSKPVVR